MDRQVALKLMTVDTMKLMVMSSLNVLYPHGQFPSNVDEVEVCAAVLNEAAKRFSERCFGKCS
jgi:hypothetical protein